jgi:hypothetical protein
MNNITFDYKLLYEKSIIEKDQLRLFIDELKSKHHNEIIEYDNKIKELTEHLKKYTNNKGSKIYYQKNKKEILEKKKEHNKLNPSKVDPEKRKEYNKRAYEKRKQKLQEKNN